jgi:DNA-binding response OmpR family regulator
MDDRPRILVVEDDARLSEMLRDLLRGVGYDVVAVADGQRALHEGLTQHFDVLLLDRGLPVINGLDVLTKLREHGVLTPTLILSALGNPFDRVEGLNRGAEDYLSKPFNIEELLARLRALQRRLLSTVPVLRIPNGHLEPSSRTVTLDDGTVVNLSGREAHLVETLARRPEQVFTRNDLMMIVFENADEVNIVDTYVHYIRKKVGRESVLTVRGIGYRLGRIR